LGYFDGMNKEHQVKKLSEKELTKAVTAYARRHNHYVAFVRANTVAKQEAIREYFNGAFVRGRLLKPLVAS